MYCRWVFSFVTRAFLTMQNNAKIFFMQSYSMPLRTTLCIC